MAKLITERPNRKKIMDDAIKRRENRQTNRDRATTTRNSLQTRRKATDKQTDRHAGRTRT